MKVGDWVLVTPDSYDIETRKISQPVLARVVTPPRGQEGRNPEVVWVKLLFHKESEGGWQMYVSQCKVVVEAPDVSESDRT